MSLVHHFSETFRSLRSPNFRLYYFGQLVSLAGTWMQGIALSWLVYRLTHSSQMLGMVSFCSSAPIIFLGIFGGFLVDRVNRRKLLILTQILSMIQAGLLAYLTLSGQIQIWQIICLAIMLGIVNALDMPCRQAFVVDLVGREDLVNAIGLSSSLFHGSRIIGPAIAGLLVGWVGEGVCFVVNAFSFLGLLAALVAMNVSAIHVQTHAKPHPRQFFEAFHFVRSNQLVRNVLLANAAICFWGMQFIVLLPLIVAEILHRQATTLGMLTATSGVGALVSALVIARWGNKKVLLPAIGIANFVCGLSLIALSQAHDLTSSLCIMFFLGAANTVSGSGSSSLLQLTVPDNLRGRLMSIFSTAVMGCLSIGALFGGFAAHKWGAPTTILVGGCVCIVVALIYLMSMPKDKQSVETAGKHCYDKNEVAI